MLNLVNLPPLMLLTQGRSEIAVALIDGPVNTSLPDFTSSTFKNVSTSGQTLSCNHANSSACFHGTLVAGILTGRRESTPAICPGCTLLLRPIFLESHREGRGLPASDPGILAAAIIETVKAGARIINLSCGVSRCSTKAEKILGYALSFAAAKGVIVVAAAGNQATVGGSCITNHPWVTAVIAIDGQGRPTAESNLSASTGQRGLAAPGQNVTSLSATGHSTRVSGTSIACPFVTGAAALLLSCFPHFSGARIKEALIGGKRARTVVPPAMNAWNAYQSLNAAADRRQIA
jgi:subtilisin family serine protease